MPRKSIHRCRGEAWQKLRMQCLVRYNFRCQFHRLGLAPIDGVCTQENPCDRLNQLQVHHVIPYAQGGPDSLENLLPICKAHHEMIHPFMKHIRNKRLQVLEYVREPLPDIPLKKVPQSED
jgi:5-methylcytosine-specific restriction endonuclease McrA